MAERFVGPSEIPRGGNIVDVPLTGGARNNVSPRHIAANEAKELLNADVSTPAFIKKRRGYLEEAVKSNGMLSPTLRPASFNDFDVDFGSRLFVVTQPGTGGGVYTTPHPDSTSPWTRRLVTKAPTGAATGHSLDVARVICPVEQGNGLLWIMGAGNVHALTVAGDLVDCGDTNESPIRNADDATYMLERLWIIRGDKLYWSKLLPSEGDLTPKPAAFARTLVGSGNGGGVLTLSPKSRAAAIAIIPWRDQSLIVFFKDRIEEIVINSGSPANSSRNVLESSIGCSSRRSVLAFGDEVVFMDNFYNLRSLRETITGQARGIALADPITEKIKQEFPGRLNKRSVDRVQTVLCGQHIILRYPRDSDTEAKHAVWYDPGSQAFEIMPAEYGHAFSDMICSNILGAEELWSTSTTGDFRLYRFDDKTFGDAGIDIELMVTLRAFDNGDPWTDKQPLHGRMEWRSKRSGQRLEAWFRTKLSDSFTLVKVSTMPVDGDFPVPRATFPVLRASFPLKRGSTARIEKFPIEGKLGYGELPEEMRMLPIYARDLPLYGDRGVGKGPVVQMRMREKSTDFIEIDSYEMKVHSYKPEYQNI